MLDDLIQECLSGNQQAWTEFVARFHRVIAATVIKTARRFKQLSPDTADDLIQQTYLRICSDDFRALRMFRSSEPKAIYGFVQSIAYSVVQDHFRSKFAITHGGAVPMVPLDLLSGRDVRDQSAPKELENEVLIREIDDLLKGAPSSPEAERDRTIFWLYYRQGLTAKAIAALPGIKLSAKGVESLIFRLTGELRRRMAELRTAPGQSAKGMSSGFSS